MLWTAIGVGVGVLVGANLTRTLDDRRGDRIRRAARRIGADDAPPSARRLREAAEAALAADPVLARLALEVMSAGRGQLELHGWVPDRRTRTRALRAIRATTGLTGLVDALRVRGEDDRPLAEATA